MSSSRNALSALKPKTFPMIEDVRLAIDRSWNLVHAIRLGLVVLVAGQPIRPDHGPGCGRRFARHRRRRLFGVHAWLRRDPEGAEDVGVLGFVVWPPVPHLLVWDDA